MTAPLPARKRWWTLFLCVAVVALVIGLAWWWFNRPIRPVELSPQEKQLVEDKVEAIQGREEAAPPAPAAEEVPAEPDYQPGERQIILTERELNGLLHEHTTLGDKLRFELATDAVHARIETDLDPDLPVLGGRKLKARARFLVAQQPGDTRFVIDDVTVWGISLPNDWLGGLKGRDLLGEAVGGGLAGVESLKVEPGRISIQLKE